MLPLAERPRSLRILCVEEDAIQRKLLKACFDGLGAEGIFAALAGEAVAIFRAHPVDMMFMDIDIHAMDELAAFESIRATPMRGHRIPILAVTENECGWADEDYREIGFAGLFPKPIEPSRLFLKMDETLREWNQPPLLLTSPIEAWKVAQVA